MALAVVLVSSRRAGTIPAASRLSQELAVPIRTVQRWHRWWREQFPLSDLWQAHCARFMPPVAPANLPASLLERFAGPAPLALQRLLIFLTPVTVGRLITLGKGR